MVTARQRLEETLDSLSRQLNWGWSFLTSAKALHNTDWQACARWFRLVSYQACLNEAVLVLAKVVIEHKDSITLFYLFNQAEHTPHLFEFADADQLRDSLAEHRKAIKEHSLLPTIKSQRDKVLAHFDKKHINDPTVITSAPVDMTEVEHCYEQLLDIFNTYQGYYNDSELYLGLSADNIEADVHYVARLVRQAGERNRSLLG